MSQKIVSLGFALAAGLCLPYVTEAQALSVTWRDGQCIANHPVMGDHAITASDIQSLKAGTAPYLTRPLSTAERKFAAGLPNDPAKACPLLMAGIRLFGLGN